MRRILALIALGSALVLVGCHTAREPKSLKPGSTVFASEEAAVNAARETLAKYLAASSRTGQSGGLDLSGFDGVVLADVLADEQADADALNSRGERLVGDMTTFGWALQQYHDGDGESALHARVCVDISNVRVFDRDGNDISAVSHRAANPYDLFFLTQDLKPRYYLQEVTKWEGEDFCLSDSVLP